MLANSLKTLAFLTALAGCTTPLSAPVGGGVPRSNTEIAREFTDLMFNTESGERIARLLRYEGPIRVSLDAGLAAYSSDLQEVLQRINQQAGIDIAMTTGSAQINIRMVPSAQLRRAFPTAACFVAPGISSWAEFRRGLTVAWSRQQNLGKTAIFIPDNAPPYIVRACLNEEIAQAMGPVNDLYRIADTVYNDDNVHNRLTSYDLLILRTLYDPRLSTGMSRAQAAPIASDILRSINPGGQRAGRTVRESARWKRIIETAMIGSNPRQTRQNAASQAIEIARSFNDHRLVHSLLVFGRLHLRSAPEIAAPAFQEAYALSVAQLGHNNLRTALSAMHIAAIALSTARFEDVITLTTNPLTVARRHKDPVLVSGLQGMRALAFSRLGKTSQAAAARRESLDQAAFAFGENAMRIAAGQAEIAGLIPAENR